MWTVDPKGMSVAALDRGKNIYDKLGDFSNTVEKVTANLVTEHNLQSYQEVRKHLIDYFNENSANFPQFKMPEYGINNAADFFLVAEEAERVRVVDKSIEETIGRNTNIGNLAVANTPRDISEAMKASRSVSEIAKTDPRLASLLSGFGFDTKKPSNIFKTLVDGNLAMSHNMTNSFKLYQLMNNKGYEKEWFDLWRGEKNKATKMSLSEFDKVQKDLSSKEFDAWKKFRNGKYKSEFGYQDSHSMIQNMFFDPGALSGTERNIVSRLVPFWGFWKKSLELSLTRINNLDFRGFYSIERFVRHFATMQNIDTADMSEFARNEQYIPFKIGENKIINLKWGNPTQTLNNLLIRDKNLFAELFGNANPALKFVVSEIANREDLFYGGKYDSLVDEAFNTLAPGAFRNIHNQIKTDISQQDADMDSKKSTLAKVMPSVFKDETISDNHAAAYDAAALVLEKALDKLMYDDDFQISQDILFPDPPEYQDYILDLF